MPAALRRLNPPASTRRRGQLRNSGLKALRKTGINIVAIHNHMKHEEPQYIFLHYWGKGPAAALAKGLRSALDTQQTARAVRVVFVCVHGAAKSVIAVAYFNKLLLGTRIESECDRQRHQP
jgi:uncharacterized protein DUF1259